ncbi:ABC transporter permease [Protaetiibacter intestinalis]|uniref:Transport permease protein n=1 Tax=Protaetiibacter intestinalis TaxID=2419774 RepID=A0A387B4B3_9MICO|nr:ABC transporter permease [Protaetiibacter intestinalis]AYF98432.1 ABC transporter permease [Protaetiibacter intestinalis]
MTPRLTLATAGRVLTQVRHDPRTIGMLLVVPALLIGLLAWIFDDTPVFAQVGPAMLGVFPFIVMFLITSITTLRERRSGTLERLLVMPLGKGDFIGGYAIAFGLLATLQAVVAAAWAVWVCGLEVEGEVWLLGAVAIANGLVGTMLGLLASAFATTEFQVVQFMPVIVAPQILLGGILLPRENMPDVLQAVSDWLPLSYSIDALNLVSTDADATGDVLADLLVVGAFALGALVLAALTLRRRTP